MLYPAAVLFHFLPDRAIKNYFLILFDIIMLLAGMNYFLIDRFEMTPLLFVVIIIYILFIFLSGSYIDNGLGIITETLKKWSKQLVIKPVITKNIILRAIEEELIWRAAFVNLAFATGMTSGGVIAIGGIFFYSIHFNTKKKLVPFVELEFMAFSFLLITVFILSGSLIITIIIHFIRNSFLLCYRENILSKEYY